jgi:hypothetical protein
LRCRENAEIFFFDVSDGLAMRADHVMVEMAVQFDSERAVVHADFFQYASFDEEMNVFVDRREGDCRYTLLDPHVDLFRAGMARHRLHDLVENLALVGCGEPVIRTKFTEGTHFDLGRALHQELVNDNYSCSSSGGIWNGREFGHPVTDRVTKSLFTPKSFSPVGRSDLIAIQRVAF